MSKKSCDVNYTAHHERSTPAQLALYIGLTNRLRKLLDAGADLNIKNKYGDTPLSWLLGPFGRDDNPDQIKLLLQYNGAKELNQFHYKLFSFLQNNFDPNEDFYLRTIQYLYKQQKCAREKNGNMDIIFGMNRDQFKVLETYSTNLVSANNFLAISDNLFDQATAKQLPSDLRKLILEYDNPFQRVQPFTSIQEVENFVKQCHESAKKEVDIKIKDNKISQTKLSLFHQTKSNTISLQTQPVTNQLVRKNQ